MNARTIRRAQERRAAKEARKAARKAEVLASDVSSSEVSTEFMYETREAEPPLTVPKTEAVTGLTGHTVLLPSDETGAYSRLIASLMAKWQPAGEEEQRLVQSLVDTEWRLMRIPVLESGIYALGRLEFAETFNHESDETLRRSLIEAHIFVAYERQLKSLAMQENRLRRQRQKDSAELHRLQQQRQNDSRDLPAEVGVESVITCAVGTMSQSDTFLSPHVPVSSGYAPVAAMLENLSAISQPRIRTGHPI